MSNQTIIGELAINLQIKLEALEKGIETAKRKLQEIEKQNESLKNSNKGLDASFIAMSATAIAVLVKIKGAVDDCVNAYNDYTSATVGLKSVLEGQGKNFKEAQGFIEEYISDGLIPLSDAVTSYKNLALRGYNDEQIKQTMINLKNAAAFGRQSTLEYGYAVRSATEGLKNMNPVLVDNAGVTKNMSVMYDEYAAKIGTTAAKLTDEQKILAEVNGIMEETKFQAGDAAKYAENYAGQQTKLNAELLNTKNEIGESLLPILTTLNTVQQWIISGIGEMVKNNKSGTAAFVAFTAAILAAIVAVKGLKIAHNAYTKSAFAAALATQGFSAALKSLFALLAANPIGLIILLIGAVVGAITSLSIEEEELQRVQAELREEQELYNQVMRHSAEVTDENIEKVEELTIRFKNFKTAIEEGRNAIEIYNAAINNGGNQGEERLYAAGRYLRAFATEQNLKNTYDIESMEELTGAIEKCTTETEKYNQIKEVSDDIDTESIRNKKKEAAQAVETAKEYQRLFNIYKTGQKGTQEYENAVETLSKAFPEAVSATGILSDEMQTFINETASNAQIAWDEAQSTIDEKIQAIEQIIANCSPNVDPDGTFKASIAEKIGVPTDEVIGKLQGLITLFTILKNTDSSQVGGVKVDKTTPKSSGSYSNKALDNYKKEIAHKKAMDQISLQQEISMYETALRKYAKTTDEKRELREKIYELNKELAQKEKDILDQQTEDYENYIEEQKNLRGSAYDITQQTQDYNKIIQMHKNYLNQIMKDERLSLDERKEIYREELQVIRDYEQQKRDLRVEHIDNTVSQLTNAITKQLEEMQEKDKELIDKNLEEVEKWKQARIDAINAEYDARIEAIEKELEALDKAEQQKTRDEEDAEYEKKKKRLEDLVAYEHDATTKVNYQKELDKLIAEYQKTLDARALEDKKEALNAQKDLLKEEQDNKTQAIEDEADKQKEVYDKQLEDLEKYYEEQMNMAQETAENMLLNMEQNQNKILSLLNSYGNAYEITGQTLGEKLAQGINEGLASKIENIISRIQNTIDANIEAQIAKMASSVYRYEAGANKPQTTSINITQQNYIEQNPEMPSETYRKLRNINEQLAADLAGM